MARVVVVGVLNRRVAACMDELCDRAAAGLVERLEVDLTGVTDATREGVAALAGCLAKRRNFRDGVGVLVANEVGRRALLESMVEV